MNLIVQTAWWLAVMAIGYGLIAGAWHGACHLARKVRYQHRQRLARVHRYVAAEHIGRHRAMWSVPLDDQPAEIIAAVVTDVKARRQP